MTREQIIAAGKRLKNARELLEMTREDVAFACMKASPGPQMPDTFDQHVTMIESLEAGNGGIFYCELAAVCRVLGISADWVLGIRPDPSVTKLIATMKGKTP